MDRETGYITGGDEDGIPAGVIREMIRRSLESATPAPGLFRFSSIAFEETPPFLSSAPSAAIEIGPPKNHRVQDGLLTGFRDFDRITGGLRKGEITTVAGLPSSGSSTLVQNISRRIVAASSEKVVAFFSLDTTEIKLVQRILGAEARLDWHSASGGFLRDSEWTRLTESVQRLWNSKLYVTDDHLISLDAVYETCAQRKRGIGLDLVVLDRVNILGMDYSGDTPPLGETMGELKSIAERLKVPVLLTWTAEHKQADDVTHRLSLHSLPSAAQVYSDSVLLIHRPDQWNTYSIPDDIPEPHKGIEVVEVNVARQTGGPPDTLRLAFNSRWGRYDNVLWD
ncbi:MAG: DnaB-like helicase C-terminal domain-containing protein [Armatimonadota bacterium]